MDVSISHPMIMLEISFSVTSFVSQQPTKQPALMTVMRSDILLISGILWEMNTMVCPCSFR